MSELQDLQGALADVDDLTDGSEPDTFWVIVNAARKYAELTQSDPIPASECVFPLVKEELLVYPTDQRQAYGYVLSTETFE